MRLLLRLMAKNAYLTLAICKPAIRRTAQPGDRILGITSHSLEKSDGYPLGSVIYAATVEEGVEARDYFVPGGTFTHRPDCIYEFHQHNGRAEHHGRTNLHRGEAHIVKDLGRYPFYRNGRVLVARDFRYFGVKGGQDSGAAAPAERRGGCAWTRSPGVYRSRPGDEGGGCAVSSPLEARDAVYAGDGGFRCLRSCSAQAEGRMLTVAAGLRSAVVSWRNDTPPFRRKL